MDILQALRIGRDAKVALVGAGGKTTAMFQLARLLAPPVILSCSTHMGDWQVKAADRHFSIMHPEELDALVGQIEGAVLFTGAVREGRRISGLDAAGLERLNEIAQRLGLPLLVEADGSRQKSLKAPGENEPAIPRWANHVVVLAGTAGLGRPLSSETVFRAEEFSRLSGVPLGEPVSAEGLARLLAHPQGGLKNIPEGAKRSLVLNQAGEEDTLAGILRVANFLKGAYDSITICSLKKKTTWANLEPAAGVLLAAGGARRYGGEPKLLLPWRGKPLVRNAAEIALAAELDPLIVVVGALEGELRAALDGLPVQILTNPEWQQGQSTSVKAGLHAVPQACGSAVFLLGDQPGVTPALVSALVERHQRTLAPVIAPHVGGRRTNPVLFDRSTFADFEIINGDIGGRVLFQKYGVDRLEWDDPTLLLDIDTPEDYEMLRKLE